MGERKPQNFKRWYIGIIIANVFYILVFYLLMIYFT